MEAARKRLWWKAGAVVLAAFVVGLVFSAYLKPDMLLVFGDLMAFCAALLK